MTNIVVMGGSFNPITKAHLETLTLAMHAVNADQAIIVLTGDHYEKQELAPFYHRKAMIEEVIDTHMSVLDFEQVTKPHPKTIQTLDYIKSMYPHAELHFMMGLDNFKSMPFWYKPEEILSKHRLIVLNRMPFLDLKTLLESDFFKPYQDHILTLDSNQMLQSISSSEVRKFIKEKRYDSTSHLIDEKVLAYIIKHQLYL